MRSRIKTMGRLKPGRLKMRRVLLAVTATAALAMPAIANAATVDRWECRVVRTTPPERNDHDPVVRTALTTMAVGNRLTGFAVEHETMTGTVYVRQQQYRNQRVWTSDNSDNWSGRSIRNPSLTMVGTLSQSPRGLFYVERLFREGRLETTIIHQCKNDLEATPNNGSGWVGHTSRASTTHPLEKSE
jgi:hypothetical protein